MIKEKAIALLLSTTTVFSGIFINKEELNTNDLYNIKTNFNKIETTLKDNENKIVEKYNNLYEDAKNRIDNGKIENEKLLYELEALNGKYITIKNENELNKDMYTNSQNQVGQLNENINSKDNHIKYLEAELEKIEELNNSIKSKDEYINQLEAKIEAMENSFNQTTENKDNMVNDEVIATPNNNPISNEDETK